MFPTRGYDVHVSFLRNGHRLLAEVGRQAVSQHGVDVVIDGFDERTDKAAALTRQASEFVKKWPSSRILLTSRAHELVSDDISIEAPLLSEQQAARLMEAVARVTHLGPQLQIAVTRPLFALLVAQHITAAEGVTGIPGIIDRVVADVVARENYNLFPQLRALAVETLRTGGAIDPATIAAADVAALIRTSPLAITTGRNCAFALATFEQWFAAQAILDDVVGMDEVVTTMDTFDRWRHVLAIIAATADPARADAMMSGLVSWNPGAASWVIEETRSGGLSRAFPDVGPQDWEAVGRRIRTAMRAWLDGLGPLADCFRTSRTFGVSFDDVAVAVGIGERRMTVTGKTAGNRDVTETEFVALQPDQRVVQRVRFDSDDPQLSGEMTMSWILEPSDGGTHVSFVCEHVPVGISESDHAEGLRSSLSNLAAYVEHRS